MADNTQLNAGAGGDIITTDDLGGGVKVPRSKIMLGGDGVNDGDVADANPMPIKLPLMAWNAPTFVSVGVASTLLLAANANRKGAIFVNDSSSVIYVGIGAAAVVGSGIRLNPSGGAYEIDAENLTTQAVNAISAVAARNVTVHEAV